MEFIARCGLPFLRRYYLGWITSPGGISLAGVGDDDRLVGVLLGALDPAVHVRAMVRRHGVALALHLAIGALRRPSLGREILATRARRYVGGVWRVLTTRGGRRPDAAVPSRADDGQVGEITHLLVDPGSQGSGLGRALVDTAIERARGAGLGAIVLVTPPDLAARRFYERLGWHEDGEITSRSGEPFVRYRYPLRRPLGEQAPPVR